MDNLFEIFSWFPAKLICKIKTICKPFSQLSNETHFKAKQAMNMLSRDDTCFILQPDKYQRSNRRIEVHPLPSEESYSGAPQEFMRHLSKSARVLASSNGLVLCCTTNKDPVELFVCNPVTKSFSPIPNSELFRGIDNVNVNIVLECYEDDYVLVLFDVPIDLDWSTSYICRVYRSKEGVWKTMKGELIPNVGSLNFEMSVIHNGVVHFFSDSYHFISGSHPSILGCYEYHEPYIVSYDLESGISKMVKLPIAAVENSRDLSCNMRIFKWGKVWNSRKSICLVRLLKSVFNVWSMEEVGERVFWRRVLRVGVKDLVGMMEKDPEVKGFMVMNGDLLIFATERKVYSCGLSDENYMEIKEICNHNCGFRPTFISYSDTLRPAC